VSGGGHCLQDLGPLMLGEGELDLLCPKCDKILTDASSRSRPSMTSCSGASARVLQPDVDPRGRT
jgi:hypothetical protein